MTSQADYDVVVIGAGVGGLTAALYCANQGLRTLVLERMMPCNQIVNAEKVENFPGFPDAPTGGELGARIQGQAMSAGVELEMAEAVGLDLEDQYRVVRTADRELRAKAIIVSAGSALRKLGLVDEGRFEGKGISHCATCDGPLFQGAPVAVVGGGDSAVDEALTLTEYCSKVYLLHRGEQLAAQRFLQDRLKTATKIELIKNAEVVKLSGEDGLAEIEVRDLSTGSQRTLAVNGLFVFVGLVPNSAFLGGILRLDEEGHIPVNAWMETEVAGVYAAGDVRRDSSRQLVSAAGDGATAALAAHRYISGRSWS